MSKFLAFAFPVESAAEAKERISEYQKKYFDARHVCWAYMIGSARTEFLSSDNGEPSGTAGKPILGQINSFGLTNVCVIVVRYFGGIKLGTSGLIDMSDVTFSFPYLAMNDVMRLTKGSDIEIISQIFDNSCEMTLRVRADELEALTSRLTDIDGVTLS